MNLQKKIVTFVSLVFICIISFVTFIFLSIILLKSLLLGLLFLGCAICSIAIFLYFTFPVLKLPKPTGKFFVGVRPYHFIDKSRLLKLTNQESYREFLGYIWFPTDSENKSFGKSFYVPEDIFEQTKILQEIMKVNACAKLDANNLSRAYKSYPIIIVSHGLGSLCNFSTAQIQELVSHGYIVIGVNHIDFCYLTTFPDGRVISFDNDKFDLPLEKFIEDKNEELLKLCEQKIDICVQDISFVIDSLEKLNQDKNSIFYKKFDLGKIGIFGHSIGGAIAAEACRVDLRCKAGISLDGSITEKTAEHKFSKPFMFIVGYLLNDKESLINRRIRKLKITHEHFKIFQRKRHYIKSLCQHIGKDGYYITFENASHFAFTDFTLASPILKRWLDYYLGANHNKDYALQINQHLIGFFDKYLKQKER